MPRVLGVHEVELNPGVDPEEFEEAARAITSGVVLPGWQMAVLKGDRGARAGRYVVIFEIDSVEARDRFFPALGQETDEVGSWFGEHPDVAAAWSRFDAMWTENPHSDYVEIAG